MMRSHIAKLASAAISAAAVLAALPAPVIAAAPVVSCGTVGTVAPTATATKAMSLKVYGKTYEITGKIRSDSNGDGLVCFRLHGNGHIKVSDNKLVATG